MTAVIYDFTAMVKKLEKPTNRIRELRKARGMTLVQLAEALDTKHNQISRFETGERELTLGWMRRIANALGTDIGDLLIADDNLAAIAEARAAAYEEMQGMIGKVAQDSRGFRAENDDVPRRA